MKYLANMITFMRILFGICILYVDPLSLSFWILYVSGGISDIIDGPIARKYKQQSTLGATFDSIADFIFMMAIFFKLLHVLTIPTWFWVNICMVLILRFATFIIGFHKHHTFVAIHTYLNKAAGCLLLLYPILYMLLGIYISGFMIGILAYLSAIEELAIVVWCKDLQRDCKSIFMLR